MASKNIAMIQRRAKQYLDAILVQSPIRIAILTHKLADPDALASTFVFSKLLEQYHIDSDIFIDSVKAISRKIISAFSIKYISSVPTKDYSMVILVDTNNLNATGVIRNYFVKAQTTFSIIDHHTPSDFSRDLPQNLVFVDETATSTSELIYFLLESIKQEALLKDFSTLLLAGILYDTNRFSFINNRVFYVVQSLIELGADYITAQNLLEREISYSEKIAKLKGVQRLKVYRIGEWLIGFTYVGSYGGTVCNTLLGLGTDLAVVCSHRGRYLILTVRSSQQFYSKTRVDLAKDVISPLIQTLDGTGGGHSTAAVMNLKNSKISCDEIFKKVLTIFEMLLGARSENV